MRRGCDTVALEKAARGRYAACGEWPCATTLEKMSDTV
jgi:hypothetical protein